MIFQCDDSWPLSQGSRARTWGTCKGTSSVEWPIYDHASYGLELCSLDLDDHVTQSDQCDWSVQIQWRTYILNWGCCDCSRLTLVPFFKFQSVGGPGGEYGQNRISFEKCFTDKACTAVSSSLSFNYTRIDTEKTTNKLSPYFKMQGKQWGIVQGRGG